MKKVISSVLFMAALVAAASFGVSAQAKPAGFSTSQFAELKSKKGTLAVPLPTWLPSGFSVETMTVKVGRKVPIEDRTFAITYSNKLASGKVQSFSIEAGFDGIGDLAFESTSTVTSGVGKIGLVYEPKDPDNDNKKAERYVMTQWFTVAGTAFHYDSAADMDDDGSKTEKISLVDTEKILKSLKRY